MIQRLSRRLLAIACFSLLLAGVVRAQSPQATISGIITDPTGAIIPDVLVSALSGAPGQRTTEARSFGGPGFGVVSSAAAGRSLQLGLRFTF